MKYLFSLFFFIQFHYSFTQNNDEIIITINLDNVEIPPVHPKCDITLIANELRDCFKKQISRNFQKQFNLSLFRKYRLKDKRYNGHVSFIIDETGLINDIKVFSSEKKLENEIIRVMRTTPKMTKPAYQDEKPVNVIYRMPFFFTTG